MSLSDFILFIEWINYFWNLSFLSFGVLLYVLFFGMNFSESKEMNGKRNECVQNARISSEKRASDRDGDSNKKELNRLFSI